jgi:YD repeat-containing protein
MVCCRKFGIEEKDTLLVLNKVDAANGKLLAYLAAHGEVLERTYDGDRALIHVRIPQRHVGPLHQEGTSFKAHTYELAPTPDEGDPSRLAQDVA